MNSKSITSYRSAGGWLEKRVVTLSMYSSAQNWSDAALTELWLSGLPACCLSGKPQTLLWIGPGRWNGPSLSLPPAGASWWRLPWGCVAGIEVQQVGRRPIRIGQVSPELCGDVLCSSWLLEPVPKPCKIEDGRQKMVLIEERRDLYLSLVQYKNHRGKLVSGKGRECCCNRGSTKRSEKRTYFSPFSQITLARQFPAGCIQCCRLLHLFPSHCFLPVNLPWMGFQPVLSAMTFWGSLSSRRVSQRVSSGQLSAQQHLTSLRLEVPTYLCSENWKGFSSKWTTGGESESILCHIIKGFYQTSWMFSSRHCLSQTILA